MKHLILMRHASAPPGDVDRERPLSAEGAREAAASGRALAALAAHGVRPERALVSPARRARETFAGVSEALGGLGVEEDEVLYLASASQLLERLRRLPDATSQWLVVGHNPGLAELSLRLAGRGEEGLRARAARGFVPGAFAALRLPGGSWRELAPAAGELLAFVSGG